MAFQIEVSHIISLISIGIAAIALYRNVKGDTKADAGQLTTMIFKLEKISEDTKEIKSDMKEIKADMDKTKERLTLNEASVKSAHKRIDYLQGLLLGHKTETEENIGA